MATEEHATEPVQSPPQVAQVASRVFLHVEHAVYAALGALLCIVAIVALTHAAADVGSTVVTWSETDRAVAIMDQLLFVLMMVEILHTVRVSMSSGTLTTEPFLVVGLIACIRRVLVITLVSSKPAKDAVVADTDRVFRASMIELGVLAGLIMVMVVSVYLIRRSRPPAGSD